MLQDVYGIKNFQAGLPKIAKKIADLGGHYLVANRNKPMFVAIPFADYQSIEDVLLESNSPQLNKEVSQARSEYAKGKTKTIDQVLK